MLPLVLFLLSVCFCCVLYGDHAPSDVVSTEYGKLQGFTTTTDAGFQADVFLGVPFARPPVGDLRFEKPRNPLPWDDIRQATEPADGCISLFNFTFSAYNMSEDCLYLNIIAPRNKTGDYPVLFIVHGSGFTMGSAHMYRDYNDIAASFVSRGIVVVIIQYRLAVYGLFSKAVQLAGSSLSEWSMSDYTLTATNKLLESLRCKSDSTGSAKRCLKEATAEEIAAAVEKILPEIFRRHTNFVAFGPRLDGDLFPKPLSELVKQAPVKPTYIGITDGAFAPEFFQLYVPSGKQTSFNYEDFVTFTKTLVVTTKAFGVKADEVTEKIVAFYLRRETSENANNVFYLRRYTQLCSDIQFNIPILREATTKAELGWPVFRYVQRHHVKNALLESLPFEAASHGSEHQFMFRGENSFLPANFSTADESVSQFLIESLVHFIKSGIPSTKDVHWPQATGQHPLRHLQITSQPVANDELFGDRLTFWNDLTNQYGFDIVEGIAVRSRQASEELYNLSR